MYMYMYIFTGSMLYFLSSHPPPPPMHADDFKPQSVDSTKPGHLKVTDDEVNVSLPVQSQVHMRTCTNLHTCINYNIILCVPSTHIIHVVVVDIL